MSDPRVHAWPLATPREPGAPSTVGSIMSHPVVAVDAGVSLEQAHARMQDAAIHHLLVTDRGHVVAVISDRDLQRGLGLGPARREDERHRRRPLFQVAAYRVVTVAESTSIREAAQTLLAHGVSALPVVDADDAIVGIVTSRDLLQYVATQDLATQAGGAEPTTRLQDVTRLPAA